MLQKAREKRGIAVAILLAISMLAGCFVIGHRSQAGISYKDVSATTDAWCYEQVLKASNLGLMSGYGNGYFGKNDPITRGQLAQILYNYYGEDVGTDLTFKDVKSTDWYANAVAWAVKTGVMSGYSNSEFGPNDKLTREQLVTVLYRVAGSPEADLDTNAYWLNAALSFKDRNSVASYAVEPMKWALHNKIVSGTSETTLSPTGTATRAQVAVIMIRYLEKFEDIKIPTPDETKPSNANAQNPDGTTNADNVNLLSNVNKSNDYPTSGSGSSNTMNENGYFTAADVDIQDAKLRYEALEFINAFLESEGLEPAVWTTSDEMEEYCLMRAKEAAANFEHERPDGSDILLGENLAQGYGTAKNTVNAWVNSKLHNSGLQGGSPSIYDTNEICVASYGDVWVYVHGNDKDLKDGAVPLISIASNNYYF